MNQDPHAYGLLAEFSSPELLVTATSRAHAKGYRCLDAYSPFPVHGLHEALGSPTNPMPAIMLTGGVLGGLTGYLMQYWATVISYPLNVGGRPLHSWPSYIPITFELTILFAASAGVIGWFVLAKFPQPYHPLFALDVFKRASRDGFFLCIEARDPLFERETCRDFLLETGAQTVVEVPQSLDASGAPGGQTAS